MTVLQPDRFFALREGECELPDGEPAQLVVLRLGELRVRSGRLGVSDALRLAEPLVVPVPPGDHPLLLTIARVDESYDLAMNREACLSLVLSDEPTASIEAAPVEAGAIETSGLAGRPGLHGVPTGDISTVAMVDADAILAGMPADATTWYDEVIGRDETGWFARMDTEIDGPWRSYFGELPLARHGENIGVANARSNRCFPVLATRDAEGRLTGIHVDLLVIGQLSEEMRAFDGRSEFAVEFAREEALRREAEARSERRGGILGRLKGLFG